MLGGNAQGVTPEFAEKFKKAKAYMAEFQYELAAPVIEGLLEKDPENANLQYLLAICFTMGPVVDNRAITLLENATVEMNLDYDARSPEERQVSQNVYFYLAVAYAQSFNFDAATQANDKFHELTGTINGRYLRDAQLWIDKMKELKGLLATSPVEPYDDTYGWNEDEDFGDPNAPIVKTFDSEPASDDGFVGDTFEDEGFNEDGASSSGAHKKFGVQIGAYANSIPSYLFSGTENVRAYRGNDGLVRFVVGSVDTREEVDNLREKMRRSGYTDAFVVLMNRGDFENEIR